jgi:NAD(P)H-hydrate epimerase
MTSRSGAGGYGGSLGRRSRRWDSVALPGATITTGPEAADLDARTIAAGVPSRALMQRAGAAAAGEIWKVVHDGARDGVVVYAGAGNNGGDGWVVARALASAGVAVQVVAVGEPRTDDARAERELAEAEPLVRVVPFDEHERDPNSGAPALLVDALLGTGVRGAPRGPVASAIARIARAREAGATIVSLDIPSGVDSDTGAGEGAVLADVTLTFGTIKRGLLVARGAAGRTLLLDIGLVRAAGSSAAEPSTSARTAVGPVPATEGVARLPLLVDGHWVRSVVPSFAAAAHTGVRKKLVIVGGQLGMAGAPVLAARAAMRSGIGMVRLVVAPESLPVVQGSEPHALARAWPEGGETAWDELVGDWADAVLVGPGLGASSETRSMVERLLKAWRGPTVLDADALNVFAGDVDALAKLLAGRPALLTPHAMEFARLSGLGIAEVLERRFDVGMELARATGATVLLKGVPTIVTAPDGSRFVSAAGTPALAAAGSGDLLGGVAATLLAQMGDAQRAGAAAAWVHGRAAEIAELGGRGGEARRRLGAPSDRTARGITLADVEEAIARVWAEDYCPLAYPVLAELPAVGGA